MRAKACVRCRQWKVGCDSDVAGAEGCSRCRSLSLTCVFDSSFHRTPKRRRLAELQSEVEELRQLTGTQSAVQQSGNSIVSPPAAPSVVSLDQATSTAPTDGPSGSAVPNLPSPSNTLESHAPSWTDGNGSTADGALQPQSTQQTLQTYSLQSQSLTDRVCLGDVQLSAAQVNELFRIYFTRCHPYLPFSICQSIEAIYQKSPLLFWVICATASPDAVRNQLEQPVRTLIGRVLDPTEGSTETVQALLILCMWPFPFTDQKSDPSFIYGGIATQIAQQIGLHRPGIDFETSNTSRGGLESGTQAKEEDVIRTTTWMACFIVNQILSSRLGVPATLLADFSLLSSLSNVGISPQLAHLCAISHLTVESAQAVGSRASNFSGLADPAPRISLINVFARQFDDLRKKRSLQETPSDIEEIFFLSSMLQLWSFALHDDVPISSDSFTIFQRAREDAIRLIQVACEKNLALVPFYTCRSVCYAALILYQIALSPYAVKDELRDDHIQRAQQALAALKSPNLSQFLVTVTSPENREEFLARRDKRISHRWKMGASLVFDSRRTYFSLLQSSFFFCPEVLDLDGFLFEGPNEPLE